MKTGIILLALLAACGGGSTTPIVVDVPQVDGDYSFVAPVDLMYCEGEINPIRAIEDVFSVYQQGIHLTLVPRSDEGTELIGTIDEDGHFNAVFVTDGIHSTLGPWEMTITLDGIFEWVRFDVWGWRGLMTTEMSYPEAGDCWAEQRFTGELE